MSATWISIVVFLTCLGLGQSAVYEYYMDSHTNCGKTYEIGLNSAVVNGMTPPGPANSNSPTSCTITLSTDSLKEARVFLVTVTAANIKAPGVSFYIYNGESTTGSSRPLDQFSYTKAPGPNYKPLRTSVGFVTFYLKKNSPTDDVGTIKIIVSTVAGNAPSPDQCVNGQGYGCENIFNYNPVITKEHITAIVGGIFGLIVFIIIPVVIIWCYCKQKGVTKRWDEYKLSGVGNTAASIAGSAPTTTKEPWSSKSSRQPYASIRKSPQLSRSRMSKPSYSDDESFDDPPKNPPPPPPYSEFDRFEKYNEKGHRGRGRRYDYDDRSDRYSDRSDRYEREEPRRNPRKERPRDRYGDAAANSYVQADDDHPQEKFVEKVIRPRVQPRSAGRVPKKSTATQDDDDTYDSIIDTKRPIDSESEAEKSDRGTQVEDLSDSEENPETESEEESSEEETESEDEKDSRKALYAQPNKARKKPSSKPDKAKSMLPKQGAQQQPPIGQVPLTNPGAVGPVPGGPAVARFPFQPGYPAVGVPVRGISPIRPVMQQGQYPPGIVRPVFTGPNQFQPVASHLNQFPPAGQFQPVRYQQPPRSAALIQPGQGHHVQQGQGHLPQPQHTTQASRQPDINTGNQPMYSYLVQRGYKPVDTDHHSQVSSATNRSHGSDLRMEDSDQGHNLGSGVDFMKRTTDV